MIKPRIAIVTVFLPRMEMDHLAEWIDYHRKVGIERFYLYNNGHTAHDPLFKIGPPSKTWHKKPEADYHLDLTDEEVDGRIADIISTNGDFIQQIPWPGGLHGRGNFMNAQVSAVNQQLQELQVSHEADWLAFIDIDELIVPTSESLSDFRNQMGTEVAAVKISQKLFESRWQEGKSVRYHDLTKAYGTLNFNRKLIARVTHARRWINAHQMKITKGRVLQVPPDRLRFHHFRGNEHHGPPAPAGFGVNKYVKYEQAIDHDDRHVVILSNPTD